MKSAHRSRLSIIFTRNLTIWCYSLVFGRYVFGGEEGYPFNVSLEVIYTLSKGRLDIGATATNIMDDGSAPFMFGLHPYWKVADISKAVVTFDPCSKWNHIGVSPVLLYPLVAA